MTLDLSRRSFFGVAASLLAAPAIVRFEPVMPAPPPKLDLAPWRLRPCTVFRLDREALRAGQVWFQRFDEETGAWFYVDRYEVLGDA